MADRWKRCYADVKIAVTDGSRDRLGKSRLSGLVDMAAVLRIGLGLLPRFGWRTRWLLEVGAVLAGLIWAVALLCAAGARADLAASWRSAPAEAPPPPADVTRAPYPVPLGEVGEISFWAPNRGLLITGGGPVSAGLYAYDGVSWHELSTVCGGARGRIAWAGPDDFWTISDQRPGQVLPPNTRFPQLQSISLCHFENGQVVGSYAMPLEQPNSYLPMDAAACYGPDDCWFGGENESTQTGAFHLHWDGNSVSAVVEPEDHAVSDMAMFAGEMYESVQIGPHDAYTPSENQEHPALIHTIAPPEGAFCGAVESDFCDLPVFSAPPNEALLPEYPKGVKPDALQGFSLATDGSPLGENASQLWAAANPLSSGALPHGTAPGQITVLRETKGSPLEQGVWSQVLPGPAGELPAGLASELLGGSESMQAEAGAERGTSEAIAPEPGSNRAWLALVSVAARRASRVALLDADGQLAEPPVELGSEAASGEEEPVGERGSAGPITCPAAHDCWLATETGWLFHLTDGSQLTPDTDPMFDGADGIIAYRPPDASVPTIYPDLPPEDDSLANQPPAPPVSHPPEKMSAGATKGAAPAKPLLKHFKSALHGNRLVISFVLTVRAHVQLLGHRDHRLVARTRTVVLASGHHTLSLTLNPHAWPDKLQLQVTPLSEGHGESSHAGGGAGDTVTT